MAAATICCRCSSHSLQPSTTECSRAPQNYCHALDLTCMHAHSTAAQVPGARDAVWGVLKAAQESKENVCVHCVHGNALTAVVLADWLLTDYIGGDNYEEVRERTCHSRACGLVWAYILRPTRASAAVA